MTLLDIYQAKVAEEDLQSDPSQLQAIAALQKITDALVEQQTTKIRLLKDLNHVLGFFTKPVMGLYLWGEVGRGKTFLLDLFFQHLPIKKKRVYTFIILCDMYISN